MHMKTGQVGRQAGHCVRACSGRQVAQRAQVRRQHAQHLLGLAGVAHHVHRAHVLPARLAPPAGGQRRQIRQPLDGRLLVQAALPDAPQRRCLRLQQPWSKYEEPVKYGEYCMWMMEMGSQGEARLVFHSSIWYSSGGGARASTLERVILMPSRGATENGPH